MGPGPGYVRGCFWCKTCSGWAYSDLSPRYALAAFVCTSRVLVTRCAGSTRADVDQRSVLNHLFCRSIFCAGSPLARCRWVALETEQTENIFCVALQVFLVFRRAVGASSPCWTTKHHLFRILRLLFINFVLKTGSVWASVPFSPLGRPCLACRAHLWRDSLVLRRSVFDPRISWFWLVPIRPRAF